MAHKRSLIPAKIQVPAAIVLAIVFATLLAFRAMKNDGDADTTVQDTNHVVYATSGPETVGERMPVSDLGDLVFKFQDKPEPAPEFPVLERNPFLIPEDAFTKALPDRGDFDVEPTTKSDLDRSGARELNSIVLTGTSKIGDQYMAIVDGMVLREGDRIAGYTIVEVGEGILYLENRRSARIVRMKEGGSR